MSGTLFVVIYFLPLFVLFIIAVAVVEKTGRQIVDKLVFWTSMMLFVVAIVCAFAGIDTAVVRTFVFAGIGDLVVAGAAWFYITMAANRIQKK